MKKVCNFLKSLQKSFEKLENLKSLAAIALSVLTISKDSFTKSNRFNLFKNVFVYIAPLKRLNRFLSFRMSHKK